LVTLAQNKINVHDVVYHSYPEQESPAVAGKPARRGAM